ncbi:MAG: S8 family serine peptidase [Bacteroidota bacterium]|nr:S8 family serine peptidase [Bacteroidota bacterium]
MRHSMIGAVLFAIFFASCGNGPELPVAPASPDKPTFSKEDGKLDPTGRYIVVFKPSVGRPEEVTDRLVAEHGGKVLFKYRHAIRGFAATLPPQAVDAIRRNPMVAYVEPDGIATAWGDQTNPPSWGLDRIDQRTLPLDQHYFYLQDGSGVTVYIIDTGIRPDHVEFYGRVLTGYDFVDNDNDANDCNGHGTHVAGTVAGTNVGVAKNARLVPVRVLDCTGSGYYSWIIAGIDWVTSTHNGPSVANMSLGGSYSQALNDAVNNSVGSGVVYTVAAGNEHKNACGYSPASAADAITVAATTSTDARASYSNYGTCVDIFAPGSSITSATYTSTTSYATWSGTSMAAPHVAGVAALYLAAYPNLTPGDVTDAILNSATIGVLTNIGTGSPNRLLYSLITPLPPPPDAPDGLTANELSSSSISIQWADKSINESGFKIERTTGNNLWAVIATVPADIVTYTDIGLSPSTNYCYRVLAYNLGGSSGYSNDDCATTLSLQDMHVGGYAGYTTSLGVNWKGNVTVTIHDPDHNPLSGATVTVSWAGGSGTAVTNSAGQCTISTPSMKKNKTPSVTMTLTSLTAPGYQYTSSQNDVPTSSVTLTAP